MEDFKQKPQEPAADTQCATVLNHLRVAGSITQHQAFTDYGYTRLAARIFELKELGFTFRTETKKNPVTGARYRRYFLTN